MLAIKLRKDYEDKSLETIIKERDKILIEIKKYEDEFIIGKLEEKTLSEPSLETFYSINNDNLIMLTELINDKLQESNNF